MTTTEHHGKYRPLWLFLNESAEPVRAMTFADVERVLGFPLPSSSRKYVQHWHGYGGSAVARAISDAGWKATKVDLNGQTVTFVRS